MKRDRAGGGTGGSGPARPSARIYAAAFAVLGALVVLRHLLWGAIGGKLPFITVFGAVALAVWLGGARAGVAVAAAGYLATILLFAFEGVRDPFQALGGFAGAFAYGFTCSLIIAFGVAMAKARARARARGELLRVTLRSIGDAVITTDVDGRVTSMNAVAESLTGWTSSQGVGRPLETVFRIVDEETGAPAENPVSRALRDGRIVGLANHTVLLTKTGDARPIDDSAAPITDEEGGVVGCVLVFRDVTAQRRLERERASQLHTARLLGAIVASSDDAIVSKTLDGTIQSWNAAAERIFGYTAEEAIGRHISLIIPPDRLAEEDAIIASLKRGERIDHMETERVRADGRLRIVSLTVSPIRNEAGEVVGASKIARDVTELREAEQREQRLLAEANAKFQAFFQQSALFAGIVSTDGTVLDVNRLAWEGCGYTREQIVGKPVWQGPWWSPSAELVARVEAATRAAAAGETFRAEMPYFVADGSQRIVDVTILPIRDAAGRVTFVAPTGVDVTERKRADVELAEADRRKNEFLAMLAHELRTPLAPIRNAARALGLGSSAPEDLRAASEILERQVVQMSRLVDDLLDMSRISQGRIEIRKSRVALAPIVDQAVETLRDMFASMECELVVRLPSEPVLLDADPARLAQIVGNLLHNACKFSDPGGRVELSAERTGDRVRIWVRDDGIGIAAEHLPRLFDMFVQVDTSLERTRGGLGIGLTLAKKLVDLHDGTLDVRSEGLGHGTEVVVSLPAPGADSPSATPAPTPRTDPASPAGTGRRVLIVDDNADSADSLALLLRHGGYETYTANDGVKTLELAERERPEIVLLDIGLPGLNGYEVCRRLRGAPWGEGILMIAMTGWGQEEDRIRSKTAGFDAHLVKPVDFDRLLALLDRSRR